MITQLKYLFATKKQVALLTNTFQVSLFKKQKPKSEALKSATKIFSLLRLFLMSLINSQLFVIRNSLKAQKIRRSRYKPHSFPHSEANIEALLTKHFAKREAISRREFQYLTGLVKSTALRTIKKLVEAGKLKNIGSTRSPLYIPTPGHYGSVKDV